MFAIGLVGWSYFSSGVRREGLIFVMDHTLIYSSDLRVFFCRLRLARVRVCSHNPGQRGSDAMVPIVIIIVVVVIIIIIIIIIIIAKTGIFLTNITVISLLLSSLKAKQTNIRS